MPAPTPPNRTVHVPVLLREVIDQLALDPGLTVLDGTIGAGGHSQKILKTIGNSGQLIGLDRDQTMLDRAAKVVAGTNVRLRQMSYAEAPQLLEELEIDHVDRVLLDLGLSSDQLADPHRGFGFDTHGELDMRFDSSSGQSVKDYFERASKEELERTFEEFGEERFASQIADGIVAKRKSGTPIHSVEQLIDVVLKKTGNKGNRRSPSVVRVFQALRIAVNDELDHLDRFLENGLPNILKQGGRAVIITFHSIEDRKVKQTFKNKQLWKNLTSKPIVPTASEVRRNPRARSAKLRVAERN